MRPFMEAVIMEPSAVPPLRGVAAMPIHDWTRVPSGLYHDFHQSWTIRIKDALNAGRLPQGLSALVEQRAGPREADVLTIEHRDSRGARSGPAQGNGPALST